MPVLSWQDVFSRLSILEHVVRGYKNYNPSIWGMPRGGTIVAGLLVAKYWGYTNLVSNPEYADVIIEDVYDTGKTFDTKLKKLGKPVCYLIHKPMENIKEWVVFPWEVGEERGAVSEENAAHELPSRAPAGHHYHMDSDDPCILNCYDRGYGNVLKRHR